MLHGILFLWCLLWKWYECGIMMLMMIDFLCLCLSVCACVHVYVYMSAADVDEDQALSDSQANSQHEFDHSHFNNFRTITVPTTTTTTTQAATTTKTKNCRGLIQKRAHTLDDFMEGKRIIKKSKQTNTIFSIKRHVTLSLQQKKLVLIQIRRILRCQHKKLTFPEKYEKNKKIAAAAYLNQTQSHLTFVQNFVGNDQIISHISPFVTLWPHFLPFPSICCIYNTIHNHFSAIATKNPPAFLLTSVLLLSPLSFPFESNTDSHTLTFASFLSITLSFLPILSISLTITRSLSFSSKWYLVRLHFL